MALAAIPSVSISDASVTEGHKDFAPLVFEVVLSEPSDVAVQVSVATGDGTAKQSSKDYFPSNQKLTFEPGKTRLTFTASAIGDVIVEDTETFVVSLSSPVNATLGRSQGIASIIDDDVAGASYIFVSWLGVSEGDEGLTSTSLVVTLAPPSDKEVTFAWRTVDDSATVANADYVSAQGMVRFAAGETSALIPFSVIGDKTFEPSESFDIVVEQAVNAIVATPKATVMIHNDEPLPTLMVPNTIHVTEGTGAGVPVFITAKLTAPAPYSLSYTSFIEPRTANLPGDLVRGTTAERFRFEAGESEAKVLVATTVGDDKPECAEGFVVRFRLAEPGGTDLVTGVIIDDDDSNTATGVMPFADCVDPLATDFQPNTPPDKPGNVYDAGVSSDAGASVERDSGTTLQDARVADTAGSDGGQVEMPEPLDATGCSCDVTRRHDTPLGSAALALASLLSIVAINRRR